LPVFALAALTTTVATAALPATRAQPRAEIGVSMRPITCASGVKRVNVRVAPGLRLIKTWTSPGSCPTTIHVATRGPSGVLWGIDSSNGLWRSTDDMRTWTRAYVAARYRAIEHALQLKSGLVLLIVYNTSGRRFILRSTNRVGTRFAKKPIFAFPFDPSKDALVPAGAPRILSPQSWVETGQAIYVGEYGTNAPNPIYLWKSTNGGQSFKVATTFTGVRHIHSVFADPFSRNTIWVTIGDNGAQPRIGYSKDGGKTFTFVSRATYPESRAVGLLFTPRAVLWATDTPDVPAGLFRWDRNTGVVKQVLEGLNGAFYYTFQYRNAYVAFSHVGTKASDSYIGDQLIHAVTSTDGSTWKSTVTPWRHNQSPDSVNRKAAIGSFTKPDRKGRFWIYFFDLAGATRNHDYVNNFELQFVRHS
jgi:hypothetical protein